MIKVNANLFRIVYAAVSTEETRYYLNGVHIEPHPEKGAILVSTDGHRMIVAHDPEGECSEGAIVKLPRFALAQCKTPTMFTAKRILEIDPGLQGSATIKEISPGKKKEDEPKIESIITVHRVIVDGTYPDWRRVIPNEPTGAHEAAPTSFNPRYMKTWGEIGIELKKAGLGTEEMQIALSTGGNPVIIRWSGSANIFGVQMPMRSSVSGYLPAFVQQPEFREAAE